MMAPNDGPRLIELCGKVRDGLISREELTELELHLLHDPEAMLLYRHFMAICSGLEQLAGAKVADEMASTDLVCEPDGDLGEQWVNQSPPKSRSRKLRAASMATRISFR